jgi:prepilin-type N-terminal cleavage/methylation domain-containing protein
MRKTADQRGVTLVELLVALAVASLLAGAGLVMARSAGSTATGGAAAAYGAAGVTSVVRAMDELRSAVTVIEARPDAVTAVVSSASSAAPLTYRDPATGQTVTLDRYTVRYVYTDGALYRDTGAQPAWARVRAPRGDGSVGFPPGAAPAVPQVGFPGQEPAAPQPVPDPGPPRYIQVYQGRTYETVFSGYSLVKSGTSGLATNSVWSQKVWVCTRYNPMEGDCLEGYWTTKYYSGGPLYITPEAYNAIRNNPVRNSDGSIAGYRISSEIWATPAGMQAIAARPYWRTCGVEQNDCLVGYWVLGESNALTASEYSATTGSPMTAQRYTDVYTQQVDPAWQQQYDAYQRYRIDYQNWQNAHATWQQRYNQWTSYYREYAGWARRTATANSLAVAMPLLTAPLGKTSPASWQAASGVQLSGQAQVVARLPRLQFSYADRNGNPTWAPGQVAVITASYTGPNGVPASASAAIGGTAASGNAAKSVYIPTPCEADPTKCPPPPPPGDPTERDFHVASSAGKDPRGRVYVGARTWEDGTTTYVMVTYDGNGRVIDWGTTSKDAYDYFKGFVQAGRTAGYDTLGYMESADWGWEARAVRSDGSTFEAGCSGACGREYGD